MSINRDDNKRPDNQSYDEAIFDPGAQVRRREDVEIDKDRERRELDDDEIDIEEPGLGGERGDLKKPESGRIGGGNSSNHFIRPSNK